VYGVESIKEVSELFRVEYIKVKNKKNAFDEVSTLFQKYVLSITFMYSIPSIKNNLGIFRKIINEEGGIWKDTARSAFYIFDVYQAVSVKTDENMTKKETENKEMVFNVKDEIERIKTVLADRTYTVAKNQNEEQVRSYYLAYILGLSTGRRFTEIFKTSSIRKKGKGYIFNGILKKDVSDKSEVEANILYLTIEEVKSYTKELREHLNAKLKTTRKKTLKEVSESNINTIFSKVYNNAIKRITKEVIPNFHELRHYYTIEGTDAFRLKGEQDKEVRYRILGHHVKADSTRTYKTIK
jgi:hypothetical protein